MEKALFLLLFLMPAASAFVLYCMGEKGGKGKKYFSLFVFVLEFLLLLWLFLDREGMTLSFPGICGMGISFGASGFGMIFALIASYMWMMTGFFSQEYMEHAGGDRKRYDAFLLVTLGAVVSLFLAADFFTAFIFFEMMSMASYVCVVHDEKTQTMYAGAVYLAIAVIGGMVSLMGLFLLYHLTGTLSFSALAQACGALLPEQKSLLYISGSLILFGFGAKASMFPLHVWLPMAHPVAPAPASALLSGIITKTGIFGVLILTSRVFLQDAVWGTAILGFGVITMLLGGILAIFSMDLKRTLACSSMSQLGFIFVGMGMQGLLGEENALAVRGTILHMFNHSNLKLVLFMAAGVIVMNLHKMDLNEIRGFGRKKPLLAFVFLMGALGIGGIPFWNGYVSKTLLHEAIIEYQEFLAGGGQMPVAFGISSVALFHRIEWLFIVTGAMTVAYMTKLFLVIFVEKNQDKEVQETFDQKRNYMTHMSAVTLSISAIALPILGILPAWTQDRIADLGQDFLYGHAPEHAVHYFSPENLKGGFYSVVIGAFIYLVVVRGWMRKKGADGVTYYVNRWPQSLDLLELVYRPVILVLMPGIAGGICKGIGGSLESLISLFRKTIFSPLKEKRKAKPGFYTAYAIGKAHYIFVRIRDLFPGGEKRNEEEYIILWEEREELLKRTNSVISSSASYSLLMFGAGMIIIVVYLFLF